MTLSLPFAALSLALLITGNHTSSPTFRGKVRFWFTSYDGAGSGRRYHSFNFTYYTCVKTGSLCYYIFFFGSTYNSSDEICVSITPIGPLLQNFILHIFARLTVITRFCKFRHFFNKSYFFPLFCHIFAQTKDKLRGEKKKNDVLLYC